MLHQRELADSIRLGFRFSGCHTPPSFNSLKPSTYHVCRSSKRKTLRDFFERGKVELSKTSYLAQKIASGNFLRVTTIVFRMQRSIISVINQKGGCAKSSTCFHTAGYFAKNGYRVLLVDADPQGSLSQAFFGSATVEALPAERTLAAIFDESNFVASLDNLKLVTPIEGIAVSYTHLTLPTKA